MKASALCLVLQQLVLSVTAQGIGKSCSKCTHMENFVHCVSVLSFALSVTTFPIINSPNANCTTVY